MTVLMDLSIRDGRPRGRLTDDGLDGEMAQPPPGPKYTGCDSLGKPWGFCSRHFNVTTATYLGLDVPCREAEVFGNLLESV
jgi:hypothetical protein